MTRICSPGCPHHSKPGPRRIRKLGSCAFNSTAICLFNQFRGERFRERVFYRFQHFQSRKWRCTAVVTLVVCVPQLFHDIFETNELLGSSVIHEIISLINQNLPKSESGSRGYERVIGCKYKNYCKVSCNRQESATIHGKCAEGNFVDQ